MKNKKMIIVAVLYLAFVIGFVLYLPSLLSFGQDNVEMVLTTGQVSEIRQMDITIGQTDSPVKIGDKIYISSGLEGRMVVTHKKRDNATPAIVLDTLEDRARVEYYLSSGKSDKLIPGIIGFQFLIFFTLILLPIVYIVKNGGFKSFNFSSGNKKYSTKYGNQGTAKEGNLSELRDLSGNDGFVLSKNVRLSAEKSWEHVLVLGPTGAGKSTSFFIPNLLDFDGNTSGVVTDPKGEMYKLTKPYLESIGYKVHKLEPLNPSASDYNYNPLAIIQDSSDIRNLAQLILTNGNKSVELSTGSSSGGAEWINMAVPLFAAALAYVSEFGKEKTIVEAIDLILQDNIKVMNEKFKKSAHAYKLFLIFKASDESERTMSSIKSVLSTNVQLFTDPRIAKFVSPPLTYDAFGNKVPDNSKLLDPKKLREEPTVLFICVPESKAIQMMPLMSVLFTQLLEITMENNFGMPILYMLDEFANIGVIPSISTVAATARSRRIGLSLGIQGTEQLKQNYGDQNASAILNNLKTKLVYSGLTGESAQYVSDLSGVTTIETKNISTNKGNGQSGFSGMFGGNNNVSKSGTRRELITPDEVRRMDEDSVLIVAHNRNPVKDKKNTYFTQKKYNNKC